MWFCKCGKIIINNPKDYLKYVQTNWHGWKNYIIFYFALSPQVLTIQTL